MRKFLFALFCSILIILPSEVFAKKVTCSNNSSYNATIEIDKEKIGLNESAFIAVSSEEKYEVQYKTDEKGYLNITTDGIVVALKEGKVTINVEVNFTEAETESSCKVDIPIEIVSNDSSLKSLTLEEFDISPLFMTDKYEYEIKLPYKFEKINIIAEANNKNAKITGDGRRYLNEGTNEYEVVVTATDGTTTTYKIIITREEANDETTLQNLIVEGYILTPNFNKDTYKYSLNVDKDVEEITINAKPTYEFAKIRGTGTFRLATGKNTYSITVTAENGNESVYEIEINRNNGSSSLKKLEIVGIQFDSKFESDKYTYYATVNSDVEVIDVKAEGSGNDQVEIIANDKLEFGKNEIIIKVTGEDKSTTTYKIIVNRLSVEEEKAIEKNNMLLKVLLVMFIIAIIFMATSICIFLKRNKKRRIKVKNININKGKTKNKKK